MTISRLPWRIGFQCPHTGEIEIRDADDLIVAFVCGPGVGRTNEDAMGNANLVVEAVNYGTKPINTPFAADCSARLP